MPVTESMLPVTGVDEALAAEVEALGLYGRHLRARRSRFARYFFDAGTLSAGMLAEACGLF